MATRPRSTRPSQTGRTGTEQLNSEIYPSCAMRTLADPHGLGGQGVTTRTAAKADSQEVVQATPRYPGCSWPVRAMGVSQNGPRLHLLP